MHPFISESLTDGRKSVVYCPSNICYRIEASPSINTDALYDFTTLFFLYKSEFPEFQEDNYQMPSGYKPRVELSKMIPHIQSKYTFSKGANPKANWPINIFNFLKNQYDIKTYFTREDEGYYSKGEVD